jgi:hypothetical protein
LAGIVEVVPEGDALPGPVLLRGDLEALLELRVELFDDVVELARAKEDGRGLSALRDDESRPPLADLLQEGPELGARDVGGDGGGRGSRLLLHPDTSGGSG